MFNHNIIESSYYCLVWKTWLANIRSTYSMDGNPCSELLNADVFLFEISQKFKGLQHISFIFTKNADPLVVLVATYKPNSQNRCWSIDSNCSYKGPFFSLVIENLVKDYVSIFPASFELLWFKLNLYKTKFRQKKKHVRTFSFSLYFVTNYSHYMSSYNKDGKVQIKVRHRISKQIWFCIEPPLGRCCWWWNNSILCLKQKADISGIFCL